VLIHVGTVFIAKDMLNFGQASIVAHQAIVILRVPCSQEVKSVDNLLILQQEVDIGLKQAGIISLLESLKSIGK
jgi:hypothetical protein